MAQKLINLMPPARLCDRVVENFARGYSLSLNLAVGQVREEVYNDLDPTLVNLFSEVSMAAETFASRVSGLPYCEETFLGYKNWSDPIGTFVRLNMSRGGLGKTFATSKRLRGGRPGDENAWATRIKALPAIGQRLCGVRFQCGCGIELCRQLMWERSTFQYLDPPYMPSTRTSRAVYGAFEMSQAQHKLLALAANECRGPIMISGYRCVEYDEWYRRWRRVDFDMPNHSGQGATKQRRVESVWMNY